MSMYRNLTTVAAVAVLGFGLAACGGGGSDSPTSSSTTTTEPAAPAPSNEQQRFDARVAVNDAVKAQEAAEMAIAAAVTAATTAMGKASDYATDAHDAATRAGDARTNAAKAMEAAMAAGGHSTDASTAKGEADDAQTALNNAIMAYTDAIEGQDIDTADGATAIQEAAEALELAANMAMEDAATAQGDAEDARDDAKEYAGKAEMYEADHVVGLLSMANADHITTAADPDANTDETEADLITKNKNAHIANVNTEVRNASGDVDGETNPGGTVAATYPHTDLGDDNAVGGTGDNADGEEGQGVPAIALTVDGSVIAALDHGNPDATPPVMANFALGLGLGDFVHEKYITGRADDGTNTGTRVILFTDIEQAGAAIPMSTVNFTGKAVNESLIASISATPVAGTDNYVGTYNHDNNSRTGAINVLFTCGTTCELERDSDDDIVTISGYTISTLTSTTAGDRGAAEVARVEETPDSTWLAFGVWLTETVVADMTNTYAFGAFADGGAAVGDTDEPNAVASVTGDATYSGKAAGVHSTATAVEFFHGDATLNAEFGNGTAIGTITGSIHDIVSGGRSVDDSIELVVVDPGAADPADNIVDAGTFSGRARMGNTGMQDSSGEDIYRMTGTWAGGFYNHMADDEMTMGVDESTRAPGSVAGTFGVSMADDEDTEMVNESESYVGAFGAHCTGSNCNPHD